MPESLRHRVSTRRTPDEHGHQADLPDGHRQRREVPFLRALRQRGTERQPGGDPPWHLHEPRNELVRWVVSVQQQCFSKALSVVCLCRVGSATMPTVHTIAGLRAVIYPNDHRPAHVHVIGRGCEAVFDSNGEHGLPQLRENYRFGSVELTKIKAALTSRHEHLCAAWNRIHHAAQE
jgi:hypothetical protein